MLEAKLAALQKDYAELHTEIFEAAQVHRRLCAPRLVRYGSFEIASEIFAVRHLPGDFVTVTSQSEKVILGLGDIRGKGLAAGMWTTHLVGLVSRYAATTSQPESIVSGVNRDICRLASAMALGSLFLARLDPVSGELEYCSAGHLPSLVMRANGELESLSKGGLLLGVDGSATYVRGSIKLHAGDALFAYSDGIIESTNGKDEEFGSARLQAELRRAQKTSADSMLFSVLGAVQDFAAVRPPADDMSLLVIRRDNL
jgi:sigma-B regulation protein RsbU (phosphoserine phosphatase)